MPRQRKYPDELRERAARLTYGAVDLLTLRRGIQRTINGEQVRLPARWSRFYPREYEPRKHAFLREHCLPAGTALDLGAHIGIFSVFMARAVGPAGRIVAFEPTPSTREILAHTVRLNGYGDVIEIRAEALGREGICAGRLAVGPLASNSNSLVEAPARWPRVDVPVTSIDAVAADLEQGVDCIKIDVEGAELDVLAGAALTLERFRPALTLEVHPAALAAAGATPDDLWEMLTSHGYRLAEDGRTLDRRRARTGERQFEIEAVPEA